MTRMRVGGILASVIVAVALVMLAVSFPSRTDISQSNVGASSERPSGNDSSETPAQPAVGQDPEHSSEPPPTSHPSVTSQPSRSEGTGDLALTPEERRGQEITGSRFDACSNVDSQYDEEVGIEYVEPVVDLVVLATMKESGGTFYATSDHSVPADDVTFPEVYRPTIVTVERILGGKLAETDGSFASAGSDLRLRLPDGKIGCDEYSSSRIGDVQAGETWVLFVDRIPTADGKPAPDPTIIRTWRLTASGRVVTGNGERVSLDEFERRASKAP